MSDAPTQEENYEPQVGNLGVPLWVIIMWVLGILWVIGYIVLGLRSTPEAW
ncbi:hypothetical protein PLCT2_02905 [Planctomycetaceae bacterium]|nr:hypothetical protein PLCT2_02905 [Planctomycetaceae bacterium]